MKSILTFCMLFWGANLCYAQWSGTNPLTTTSDVGIGTNSPAGKLDIFNATNLANTPLISIRSKFHTPGDYGMIRFGDYTQTNYYQKGALIYESVSGAARGKFHIALENTDGSASVNLSDAKLTVMSNGNVGLGITSPSAKLHVVNGTARFENNSSTDVVSDFTNGIDTNLDIVISPAGAADKKAFLGPLTNSSLVLGQNNVEAMRIVPGGNIGIGTATPDGAYKLSVNGSVRAKKVVVETGWADDVFFNSYRLRPLSEVKDYTEKYKHLPEIPSAAEVAANGVSLGEINKLLLKKVEELTLYLIKENEDKKRIITKLTTLEKQIATIKKSK